MSQHKEVEAALAASPELRELLDGIRRTAHLVDNALEHEPSSSLSSQQRTTIANASGGATAGPHVDEPADSTAIASDRGRWLLPLALAASLLLIVSVLGVWSARQRPEALVAKSESSLSNEENEGTSPSATHRVSPADRTSRFKDSNDESGKGLQRSAAESLADNESPSYSRSVADYYREGGGYVGSDLYGPTPDAARPATSSPTTPQFGGFDPGSNGNQPGYASGPTPPGSAGREPQSSDGPFGDLSQSQSASRPGMRGGDLGEDRGGRVANPSDQPPAEPNAPVSDPFDGAPAGGPAAASGEPAPASPANGLGNRTANPEYSSRLRRFNEDGDRPTPFAEPRSESEPGPAGDAEVESKRESPVEDRTEQLRVLDSKGSDTLASSGKKEGKNQSRPQSWQRDPARPNTSRLMVGDNDSLALEGMQVNVVVDGFRARVLLDCYYHNDRGRQLEGSFQLRLPNEASLYYFAFGETSFQYQPMVDQLASRGFLSPELMRASGTGPDGIRAARGETWTNVKEARLVPREKAAHAYSEVVRRRVDPALVEWSGAGVFQAKVYPLQPGKLHRIVVGYDVNLRQDGEDLVYSVPLPDISQCTVDLDVAAIPGASAEVTPAVRPFVSGGRAFYHFDKPEGGAVDVRLQAPGNLLLTGQDTEAGDFFATRFTPELPAGEQQTTSSHAVFLLDTSLSSRPDKFNVWLKLLETTLRENRDSLKQFAVLTFNIESHWWRPGYSENTEANVEQLLNDCRALALEGATDLSQAVSEATSPAWSAEQKLPTPDLFLLSDGAATWGELNPQMLLRSLRAGSGGTLFAYQTGLTGTEVGLLELLTRETGGAVFSMVSEQEVVQASKAHRQRPWQLIHTTLAGGSDLLIAGRPRSIYPGQSLLMVGRGVPQGEVTLQLRRGDQRHEARVALHRTVVSQLAPRVYGQVAVGQLEDLMDATLPISEAYARHFRVTGRSCSLLMLESEADYQRYDIRPEDDLFVVNSTPSDPLIVRKLDELAGQLADPKVQMQQWLSRLEKAPGLQFSMPAAMQLAIEQMPASAFEVRVPRLECRRRDQEALPKNYVQWLAERDLNYAAITEEADRRREQDGPADALRAVSNLVERSPGDDVIVQDVAFSAIRWGLPGQAYPLLQRVANRRPYQPHIYTAMGQCLAETGNADLAMVYYEVALNGRWNDRYRDVRTIAAVEYSHLLRRIASGELNTTAPDYARARLESLSASAEAKPADLVVVMMWNTDRTDVDLHVQEASGEECYYKNPNTRSGGKISGDVTEGFGPEMYTLQAAPAGRYTVKANYYNTDANRTGVRTKVYVTVYEYFGTKRESVSRHVVTLAGDKEKRDIVSITIKN
jgi:hypothetical protein